MSLVSIAEEVRTVARKVWHKTVLAREERIMADPQVKIALGEVLTAADVLSLKMSALREACRKADPTVEIALTMDGRK